MPDPLKDLSDLRKLFPELENYVPDPAEETEEKADTSLTAREKSAMKLYISRDKKQRAGKTVTLVEGFTGPEDEAVKMLAALKALCATGGVFKDDTIQLQGDHVRKVMDWLAKQGFKQVKQKGG